MRLFLSPVLCVLAACNAPPKPPAPPPGPDATDAAPLPPDDAGPYAACCEAMATAGCDDGGDTCASTLKHIVTTSLIRSPCACRACNMACK